MYKRFWHLFIAAGTACGVIATNGFASFADDSPVMRLRRQVAITNASLDVYLHSQRRLPRPAPSIISTPSTSPGPSTQAVSDENSLLIERPSSSLAQDTFQPSSSLYQVSHSVARWLKHYGHPVICNMMFCNGSCQNFDDGCPSFSRPIAEFLYADTSGCAMPSSPIGAACSANEQGESCCPK
jgi:hypothetical protein